MRVLTAAGILAASVTMTAAQEVKPFGITPGSQVTEYKLPEPDSLIAFANKDKGKVDLDFAVGVLPPDPHPEFADYHVHQTPKTGICLVRAVRSIEPGYRESEPGKSVRDFFKKIETQITSRYGEGSFSETFSLFSYDKDWISDIGKDEKYYRTIWKPEAKSGDLQVKDIILYVDEMGSGATVNVQYTFSNYDECRAIRDKTTPEAIESEASKF